MASYDAPAADHRPGRQRAMTVTGSHCLVGYYRGAAPLVTRAVDFEAPFMVGFDSPAGTDDSHERRNPEGEGSRPL